MIPVFICLIIALFILAIVMTTVALFADVDGNSPEDKKLANKAWVIVSLCIAVILTLGVVIGIEQRRMEHEKREWVREVWGILGVTETTP